MRKLKSQIYSIFGQIEEAAANTLIEAGEAKRIEPEMIPPSAPHLSENGLPVKFAVLIPGDKIAKFERLISDLYA